MTESMSARGRLLFAFRLVQWATLAALAWKIGAFIEMIRCYFSTPLRQDFFPTVFESPILLSGAYIGVICTLAASAMSEKPRPRTIASWGTLGFVSFLGIHQGSYNDMTFATAWWTALWSVWLSNRIDRDDPERLLSRAAFIARCIVSLIFLGGAVGKWTGEYWSGQVLYEIYFVDRDFWLFNLLRKNLDPEMLRVAATWYSRQVIVTESLCGVGLWLLSPRWAATIAIVVFASIAVFSNFYLFSVLLSLIGLAATGFFVTRVTKTTAISSSQI